MLTIKFSKILLLMSLSVMIAIVPALLNAEAAAGKTSKVIFAVE